jgi:hypothetical protein
MQAGKEDKYRQAEVFKDIERSPADNETCRKDTHRQTEKCTDKQRKA